MRRILLISGVVLTVVLAAAGIVVNLRGAGAEPLPAPDPAMLITLPDGTALPLSQLLADVERKQQVLPSPPLDNRFPGLERAPDSVADLGIPKGVWHAQFGSVFALAEEHRHKGHLDQAEALYLSIAEGEPGYAYAQRRLAWDVLTLGRGDPQRAVGYAHEALRVDPFNGNSWQDAVRVYGRTLSLPVQ